MHKCTLHTAKPFVNCGKFKSRGLKGKKISKGVDWIPLTIKFDAI